MENFLGGVSLNPQNLLRTGQSVFGNFFGYGEDAIPRNQAVVIRAKSLNNIPIVLAMQDKFSLSVESFWASISDLAGDNSQTDMANLIVQLFSGGRASVVNEETSRRFWKGTSPLRLSLPLKLDAEVDARVEVLGTIQNLKSLALPTKVGMGFMAPPGPSPFRLSNETVALAKSAAEEFEGLSEKVQRAVTAFQSYDQSDSISITIGNNFLHFENIIIKSVQTDIYNMFTREGLPVAADVNVEFETYMMVSKDELQKIFTGQPYIPTMGTSKDNKFFSTAKKVLDLI